MDRQTNVTESPIRQARRAAGLSPEGLAFKAGLSMRTVERIELGQVNPRRSTIKVIADALGVDPAELVGEEAA